MLGLWNLRIHISGGKLTALAAWPDILASHAQQTLSHEFASKRIERGQNNAMKGAHRELPKSHSEEE